VIVYVCACVCVCSYTDSLLAWRLTNRSCKFRQIHSLCAVQDKDELMRFWDHEVIVKVVARRNMVK